MAQHSAIEPESRVIDIRTGRPRRSRASGQVPASGDSLSDFARDEQPDDFGHRMITNVIAFVFVAALVVAGLWLADSIARMRKDQDCVLSGKRGCSPVEAPVTGGR